MAMRALIPLGLMSVLVLAPLGAGPASGLSAGVLTITTSPAGLGALTPGSDNTSLALGAITITDTLADPTPTAWVASVAASACAPAVSPSGQWANLNLSNASVPPTALTFHPGPITTLTASGTQEVAPVASASFSFGALAGTYSPPAVIATGPASSAQPPSAGTLDNNGVFSQTAALDIDLTATPTLGVTYDCTLQYTLTG